MFIVLVWDENYIAQFSVPSPAEATRKAKELLKEGRLNIFIRDSDRHEDRPEHFETLQVAQIR